MAGTDIRRPSTDTAATSTDTAVIPNSVARFVRFDALRGICAIAIVVYHIGEEASISPEPGFAGVPFWGNLMQNFRIFLPPLMVLSAFLLYRPFARAIIGDTPRPAAVPFILGRALRMLPAFWALFLFVTFTLNLHSAHGVAWWLKPFFLVHFWLTPDLGQWMPAMEHSWTVSVEMSLYFFLPIAAYFINRRARKGTTPEEKARRIIVPVAVMMLVGLGWMFFAYTPARGIQTYYYIFMPFGYAAFFGAGMAIATLSAYRQVTGKTPRIHQWIAEHPLACFGGAAVAFLLYFPRFFGPNDGMVGTWGAEADHMVEYVLFFTFGTLTVLPLTVPEFTHRAIDPILNNRTLANVGRYSYGIYLWNVPVMYLYFHRGLLFGNTPLGMNDVPPHMKLPEVLWFFVYCFGVTGMMTWLSWNLIEHPAIRLRTRFGAPKSALELGYSQLTPTSG